jgi:hypothetical protein
MSKNSNRRSFWLCLQALYECDELRCAYETLGFLLIQNFHRKAFLSVEKVKARENHRPELSHRVLFEGEWCFSANSPKFFFFSGIIQTHVLLLLLFKTVAIKAIMACYGMFIRKLKKKKPSCMDCQSPCWKTEWSTFCWQTMDIARSSRGLCNDVHGRHGPCEGPACSGPRSEAFATSTENVDSAAWASHGPPRRRPPTWSFCGPRPGPKLNNEKWKNWPVLPELDYQLKFWSDLGDLTWHNSIFAISTI